MRKIALLAVPLLILGLVSVSADPMMAEDGITATVSGNATLTWGIDLETNATGFTSAMENNFEVTIYPEQSADTGMMDTGDLYAYIKLSDFKWVADKDGSLTTPPGIEAKLIMGAFSIKTFSSPAVEVDYVDPQDADKADGTDEDEFPGADFDDVETVYKGLGLTVAYEIDPVVLSLGVVSENDWTESKPDPANKDVVDCHSHAPDADGVYLIVKCPAEDLDDQNDENAYAFIGTINLAIGENAELEAKVAYAHEYGSGGYENNDDIGVGAKATFNLGDITPHIAFDTAIPSGGATIPWDVGGGVKWNLSADEKSSFSTNLMMFSPTVGDSRLYVSASLVEGEGDDGALEGMGATLTVGLDDAAGDSNWNARVTASYKVEGIKPYFDVSFGSADDAKTSFKAGLELTMISHLTTTLQYATEDIGGTDKGAVTTALKISY